MQEEVWKDIPEYEGLYQVSNLGRVRSLDRYIPTRTGRGKQTGRVLKLHKCYKGYLRVGLSVDKKTFRTGAHRLVAKAFIPNPENKPQVNHVNGIKNDNNVNNLEWVTNTENINHAFKNNLINLKYGENHHMSKITNKQMDEILVKRKNGYTLNQLSIEYKLSISAISNRINKNK